MLRQGDPVRVREVWPERQAPAHIRTPWYLRGQHGRVLRHLGDYPNSEDLAFARPAEPRALYHVEFDRRAIWPEGSANDTLVVELYEHWLERV